MQNNVIEFSGEKLTEKKIVLTLKNITKDFPGVRALDNVTFDLYAGEVHCLVGENGAGKSTLIKILSGAEVLDKGEIILFDKSYPSFSTSQAMQLKIATIYQDVNLVKSLTVADNIFLGNELKNKFNLIDRKAQIQQSKAIMKRIKVKIDPTLLVSDLSAAEKQILQIIKAIHQDARIMVMDEPTAFLGFEETEALMSLIKDLAAEGLGIIYISHYLQEVNRIGDRITVLKDGKLINTYVKSTVSTERLIQDMIGRKSDLFYHKDNVKLGDESLRIEGITKARRVRNVSFSVREGEVFGVGGIVGSGRSDLAKMIFGAEICESGRVYLNGIEITPKNPKEAIRRKICMLMEDRKENGLFLLRPVFENIQIADNELNHFYINPSKERENVGEIIDRLDIQLVNIGQNIESLSGGNQQKCILGRWLIIDSDVIIFDEPTKGVDIGAKQEIYRLITELSQMGKIIILISSDMPELISMSDRIGVMRDGEMVSIINKSEATEKRLIKEYLGD